MAGFRETGLLAANASITFPAFIFKNALAAYNGNWGDCRFSIADCRLPIEDIGTRISPNFTTFRRQAGRNTFRA